MAALLKVIRARENPLLAPRTEAVHWWEKHGVFNAAAAEYQGKIVLLYRAVDPLMISRLGLASSEDGVTFERLDLPVVDADPNEPFERMGVEDPRMTPIEGTYYVVYTAASLHRIGEDVPDLAGISADIPWRVRVALMSTTDFKEFTRHGIILPDVTAKNAMLFPGKLNGRYVLHYRHGITPMVAYSDDLLHWVDHQQIAWPNPEPWEALKVGGGAPPLETEKGWLMVYHAVDANRVYRLGLALFDREDPSRLVKRVGPIMEPEEPYERQGYVPNVVFTCGLVQRGDEVLIYYGGADYVIGLARMSLSEALAVLG
ncbi:MAG: glycosidase [Armatimonadetes bacterium]|nr:glycosidase [Armatimonadota bacterium]